MIHCVGDLDRVAVGLLQHVDEHGVAPVRRDDVIGRLLGDHHAGDVADLDGRALHDVHHDIANLFRVADQPGHGCKVQVVVFLHHARRRHQVGVAQRVNDLRERDAVAVQLLRIDHHVIFLRAAADDVRLGHARQAVEPRSVIVVSEFPEIRQRARGRRDAEADHREHGEGHAIDVETRPAGQRRRDFGDASLDAVQGVLHVHVPAKKDVDVRASARRDRLDRRDPRHRADGLFERARYRQHLHVDRCDAVVHANDDSGKIGLRKDRNGDLRRQHHAGGGEGEEHQHERPAVRIDKSGQRRGHLFSPFAPASFTCTLSSSP